MIKQTFLLCAIFPASLCYNAVQILSWSSSGCRKVQDVVFTYVLNECFQSDIPEYVQYNTNSSATDSSIALTLSYYTDSTCSTKTAALTTTFPTSCDSLTYNPYKFGSTKDTFTSYVIASFVNAPQPLQAGLYVQSRYLRRLLTFNYISS